MREMVLMVLMVLAGMALGATISLVSCFAGAWIAHRADDGRSPVPTLADLIDTDDGDEPQHEGEDVKGLAEL